MASSLDPAREQIARVRQSAYDGGGGGHRGRHQMGARTRSLSSLEIAIGRRGAALACGHGIAVHRHTHRAPGIDPLETRILEDLRKPLLFGLPLHYKRA